MANSIYPDSGSAGGVEYRNADGTCLLPLPDIHNAYCPPTTYKSTCDLTALPSNCDARIEPRQINAIVSELVAFASCIDPTGTWNCDSLQNLCAAFTAWAVLNTTRVYIADTPPAGALHRDLWWESDSGILFINYDDGNSLQWVQTGPPVPGKEVYIGDAPPGGAPPETLWWESDSGNLFINYNDGNTTQWVQAVNTTTVVDRVSIIGAGTTVDPYVVALVDCGTW